MSDPAAQATPPPDPYVLRPHGGGRPLLATLLGALVVLLPLAAPPRAEGPYDLAGKLGALTGSVIFALIVWGICYAITIRRASTGWKIASAAAMIVISLFVGLVGLGRHGIVRQDEARALTAQLKKLADADPASASFDAGAGAGPLTRLTAAITTPLLADARRLAAAQKDAGLDQLILPGRLTQDAPVLDHCEQVAALGPMTTATAARFPLYLDAVRKEGDAIVAAGQASRGEVDNFVTDLASSQEKFARQGALAAQIAGNGAELCRILAKRNWIRGANGNIDFTNKADLAAAQAVQSRLNPVLAEFNANRAAGAASLDAMPGR